MKSLVISLVLVASVAFAGNIVWLTPTDGGAMLNVDVLGAVAFAKEAHTEASYVEEQIPAIGDGSTGVVVQAVMTNEISAARATGRWVRQNPGKTVTGVLGALGAGWAAGWYDPSEWVGLGGGDDSKKSDEPAQTPQVTPNDLTSQQKGDNNRIYYGYPAGGGSPKVSSVQDGNGNILIVEPVQFQQEAAQ